MDDPVSVTIKSYQAKVQEYISKTNQLAFFPDLPSMLDRFISELSGPRILDVAFGSGRDTLYLIEHGLNVAGVELTEAFITELKKIVDIPAYRMDMRYLAFADDIFDGIWCCAAFLHLPRKDALPTLRGFARILKPQGILYLDLKEGIGEEWVNSKEGNVTSVARYFTYYSYEQIRGLLEVAGLDLIFSRRQENIKLNKPKWINLICRKRRSG